MSGAAVQFGKPAPAAPPTERDATSASKLEPQLLEEGHVLVDVSNDQLDVIDTLDHPCLLTSRPNLSWSGDYTALRNSS